MLNKLDGYDVTAAELQEYIAGLTVPAFDVEVLKKGNIYEVYCNGTLLYYSEIEIKADKEQERLEDCWQIEQAQIHFADRKIMPVPEPEPAPELTDRELMQQILDIQIEQALNIEYMACLKELGI
ncbi:MAG TPA: hypothetical protein DCM01_07770 [Dielma fastidiosa]|nr:hypothetical protein [Dielma fastidiosa]